MYRVACPIPSVHPVPLYHWDEMGPGGMSHNVPCSMPNSLPPVGISVETPDLVVESNSTEAHCLRLPGKRLDVSALLYAKKFRAHGHKKGAEAALQKLHEAGLGIFEPTKGKK